MTVGSECEKAITTVNYGKVTYMVIYKYIIIIVNILYIVGSSNGWYHSFEANPFGLVTLTLLK